MIKTLHTSLALYRQNIGSANSPHSEKCSPQATALTTLEVLQLELPCLNFAHHCNHVKMPPKILKFITYGPFQVRFASPFQAVDGCGRLFDTALSRHQFAILVHDVISGFAIGIAGIRRMARRLYCSVDSEFVKDYKNLAADH